MNSEPSPQSLTPISDDAFDAYARQACGTAWLKHKMAEMELELTQLRTERDSLKVENEQLRAENSSLRNRLTDPDGVLP